MAVGHTLHFMQKKQVTLIRGHREQIQRHGWYVCCECLDQTFGSKEELDAHKQSRSCARHCVNANCHGNSAAAAGLRHVISKKCGFRSRQSRRSRYEYVCQMLGREVKRTFAGRCHMEPR